jgi:hypothetical protein
MSEYQYYEFQAIDRPLTKADQGALRALSSRARITATSFTNHYEWGNFRGDPKQLMARYFDLHLYLANWGTRRLMIRLPERLVDRAALDAFLQPVDWVEVQVSDRNLIVDIYRDEDEPLDIDWEDSDWLRRLAPLRADAMSGDLRLFYLLWLAAVETEAVGDAAAEPLPGIGPLTGPLEALAEFVAIDPDLVAAAAERGSAAGADALSNDLVRRELAAIPETEKTEMLLRLAMDDPHVANELKRRLRPPAVPPPKGARTAGALRARAAAIREDRERAAAERLAQERRRQAEEEERQRRLRLAGLKRQGEGAWRDVEAQIMRRNPAGYDAATRLLFDLKALAAAEGMTADFGRRLEAIRVQHARKGGFIERLKGLTAG